ncbi:hypothetical protein [Frankia sp. R82]|uniref:hypothetical protein n=1 Tax=Frankia sp. R82 TaxID=2950553 RepID=UPI002043F453|nr:hypothetical protein [Frankia sp. R82]MCM3886813.1 hypothetical protein [Frankia sp. R82]
MHPNPTRNSSTSPTTTPHPTPWEAPPGEPPHLIETTDGLIRIDDHRHGLLQVHATTLSTAVTHTPQTLRRILADSPWIGLDGTETLITLAALTAIHAPERLKGSGLDESASVKPLEAPDVNHIHPPHTTIPAALPATEQPDLGP